MVPPKAAVPQLVGVNHTPFEKLAEEVTTLGTQAGQGRDSQVRFHMLLVDKAHGRLLDNAPDKHGNSRDDASVLTEAYYKAQGSNTHFDPRSIKGHAKAVACARKCIEVGGMHALGQGEPVRSMNALMNFYKKNRANKETSKRLDDATNTLLRWARAQTKSVLVFDDDELEQFCFRKTREIANADEVRRKIRKDLQALFTGMAAGGTACDNSQLVKDALDALIKREVEAAIEKKKQPEPAKATA